MHNILLVRLTSMGDIIHNFPAVTDLANYYPQARIDWLVGADFAELPRLHPAIHTVIPCAERQWRKNFFSVQSWEALQVCRKALQHTPYDLVIDSQGLLKSAWFSRIPNRPTAGYDARSAKESFASYFYTYPYTVPRRLSSIQRNRLLTGLACGYTPSPTINYGIPLLEKNLAWLPENYLVLLTATSRLDKQWPMQDWIRLGQSLAADYSLVLPWGTPAEQAYCLQLAEYFPATIAPTLSLTEAAVMLQMAKLVVGVDTGLTHLAAAVNTPVVALFCASDPLLNGAQSARYAVNLGKPAAPPSVEEALFAVKQGLMV